MGTYLDIHIVSASVGLLTTAFCLQLEITPTEAEDLGILTFETEVLGVEQPQKFSASVGLLTTAFCL